MRTALSIIAITVATASVVTWYSARPRADERKPAPLIQTTPATARDHAIARVPVAVSPASRLAMAEAATVEAEPTPRDREPQAEPADDPAAILEPSEQWMVEDDSRTWPTVLRSELADRVRTSLGHAGSVEELDCRWSTCRTVVTLATQDELRQWQERIALASGSWEGPISFSEPSKVSNGALQMTVYFGRASPDEP
jgi:hypothetical protein